MNGDQQLMADSAGNITYYLYGLGTIGEKTTALRHALSGRQESAWNYSLPDGTNTPRQPTKKMPTLEVSASWQNAVSVLHLTWQRKCNLSLNHRVLSSQAHLAL